jgi:magnesium-transporting ATPase (P-type)
LAAALSTDAVAGLAGEAGDLSTRRLFFGANAMSERSPLSLWALVVSAASDPTVLTLIACGVASLALELGVATQEAASAAGAAVASTTPGPPGWVDGAAILGATAIVVGVTAANDAQKEAQFRGLAALAADPLVTVIRGGASREVRSSELVVGDLMLFEAGDILPADGLAVAAADLTCDESVLTGEARDVRKRVGSPLLSGARVLAGRGAGLVTGVGLNSTAGAIQAAVVAGMGGGGEELSAAIALDPAAGLREQTNLERKLGALAAQIGQAGAAAAAVVGTALAAPLVAGLLDGDHRPGRRDSGGPPARGHGQPRLQRAEDAVRLRASAAAGGRGNDGLRDCRVHGQDWDPDRERNGRVAVVAGRARSGRAGQRCVQGAARGRGRPCAGSRTPWRGVGAPTGPHAAGV